MNKIFYSDCAIPIRDDLIQVHTATWDHLANPGSWFTGAERVAIMAEVRHAWRCRLCQARKAALSPYALEGEHDHLGALPEVLVEVLHRVCSDPGRLTPAWFASVTGEALTVERYVEAVGVMAQTIAIDTFAHSAGLTLLPLPTPVAGDPSGYRPEGLRDGEAWVALLGPDTATEAEADLYPSDRPAANIRRAMSLVPAEVRSFFRLVETQYLPPQVMVDFDRNIRAIDHAQIELVAGRISSINGCVY